MHAFVGAPVRWRVPRPAASRTGRRICPCAKKGRAEQPKKPRRARKNSPTPPPSVPDATPVDVSAAPVDEEYIPQGPTLRAEYEMRGIIDPEVRPADAGVLPEVVADRMLRRILLFGGIPFGLLFGFFALYFVLTYKFEIRVIPGVVAYSTLSLIAAAAAGISYGIFSSSWDVENEGSKLGWKEAKVNLFRARDGLMRQRMNEKQLDEFDRIEEIERERREEERSSEK